MAYLGKNGKTEVYAMFTAATTAVFIVATNEHTHIHTTIEIHFGLTWTGIHQCVTDWFYLLLFVQNDSISKQQFMCIFIVFHVYNINVSLNA